MMTKSEALPLPVVREVMFSDLRETLQKMSEIGADASIERTAELNAALIDLPIISTALEFLSLWKGDIMQLPDVDSLLDSLNEYNTLSKSMISEIARH